MTVDWSSAVTWASHPSLWSTAVGFLAFAFVLWPVEKLWPAYRNQPVCRRGFATDLIFWMFSPLVGKALAYGVVTALVADLMALRGRSLDLTDTEGWGPVGQLPLWVQAILAFVVADFVFYWVHRGFHISKLWPFHAVHHSGEQMDWVSSMRFHPVNEVLSRVCQAIPLILLGFAPAAVVCAIPVVVAFIVVTHSNVGWTWGPLGWVFVSPVYHHWHHSSEPDAIDKNFAGALVIWDRLFGTYYNPSTHRPSQFGVVGARLPGSMVGLLLYPFLAILNPFRQSDSRCRKLEKTEPV